MSPYDALRSQLFTKTSRLRIGFFVFDGSFVPVPAAQRAVLHAKSLLEAKGHEVSRNRDDNRIFFNLFISIRKFTSFR
ncbi:unnamed protein product [Protopolystoma xenopodis]|uniref:Amidase domain-containing protein n=1 Tax=Protopolystoma xenopodis TaxID=117903 RepID=A0A3S5A4A5_9PLAT|nr:unnamed protein product [Protopolystoma xenopodis]